jgi:23S rRNA (adenine2503-C2)-methyltransferase
MNDLPESMPWEAPVPVAPVVDPVLTPMDVLSLSEDELVAWVGTLGEPAFRGKQLFVWLHRHRADSFANMTSLSKVLRAHMRTYAVLTRPAVSDVKQAKDGTRKYELKTHDGHIIEAVFIPHASGLHRHALCISSQVGCAMGCRFCATAAMKLSRHLTAGEIVGQVYAVMDDLERHVPEASIPVPSKYRSEDIDASIDDMGEDGTADGFAEADGKPRRRIQNIVYMGMGEPLHNLDHVVRSIKLLTHMAGQGMSPRRLTVSTSGLATQLATLGELTDVHIAISLNATTDAVRGAIMPVNKRHDIEALLAACRNFPLHRRRRITFEYVMLAGINDSDEDAKRLAVMMKPFKAKVNLIPFNPHPLSPYTRPDDARVSVFRDALVKANISVFVRTTRGLDIDAACGMLGAKKLSDARASLVVLP